MEPITWLTSGPYVDYRPVFSPDGSSILFERSPLGTKDQQVLYVIPSTGGTPSLFLSDPPPKLGAQTRPDWSTAGVAFCRNKGPIHLADSDGTNVRTLSGTAGMVYPAWYLTKWLAVMFTNDGAPYTVKIDTTGKNLGRLSPTDLYAGMPSISRQTPPVLAFPGQPAQGKYDQDNNKIYISNNPSSATLLDGEQGRAPWWSANGQLLAFESSRAGGQDGYAIFTANPDGSNEVQLTDTTYNAQHPKFSPDGTTIVFAAQPNGTGKGKEWAIATIPFNP